MKQDNIINTFKTLKEVEDYRAMVNEMCDKRSEFIAICEQANKISNKSFGFIKESFEAISPELFKTNEGKKLMNKYTKTIKESKNLSTLHNIHENIRKAGPNTDMNFFINNLALSESSVNVNDLNKETKELGRILAEGYMLIGKDADSMLPSENISLDKAVSFIAENKYSNKNLAEYSDAMKVIREHIMSKKETKNVFESVDLDSLAKSLIDEFNLKYSKLLTVEESKIIKELGNSENREVVFNKYKQDCVAKINEAKMKFDSNGDKSSSDRLGIVLEKIESKTFSSDTVGTDICSLIELTNIFE
jgi:hypothetical protein